MADSCPLPGTTPETFPDPQFDPPASGTQAQAVLAGGCFWCTEAVYRQLDGVLAVESGYSGGDPARANYAAVCTGSTGHAEAIRISYDPQRLSYGQLLKVFFSVAHDPTQLMFCRWTRHRPTRTSHKHALRNGVQWPSPLSRR